LKLPLAGYRNYSNASISSQNSYGYYWSSSPASSNSYYLYLFSSSISPQSSTYRSYGYSVRCFKDSQDTKTLTFNSDNGEDNVVYNVRWWEPITTYEFTPEKK
jgi:hypothetical protein